jgi:hypothetical protein
MAERKTECGKHVGEQRCTKKKVGRSEILFRKVVQECCERILGQVAGVS